MFDYLLTRSSCRSSEDRLHQSCRRLSCKQTTIFAVENPIEELISTFRKENQAPIGWFVSNEKIVICDKFQAIIVKRNNKTKDSYPLHINQEVIESEKCAKLLGVKIDNKLFFEKYISTLGEKGNELNIISRMQKFMGFKEKKFC